MVRRVAAGPWFRLHQGGRDPLHFGRGRRYRFDDPRGKFGVLYVGADPYCAFIETFGQSLAPPAASHGVRYICDEELGSRELARVRPRRTLRLVDLTGAGLALIGADARLCTGDYRVAQRWSLVIHEHPSRPDGLLYRARRDPSRLSVALFHRARARISGTSMGPLMSPSNRELRDGILGRYGLGLLIVPPE